MSIINDALKKAQKNLSQQKKKIRPPQEGPSAPLNPQIGTKEVPPQGERDKVKISVILALFPIIILLGTVLFIFLQKNTGNADRMIAPSNAELTPGIEATAKADASNKLFLHPASSFERQTLRGDMTIPLSAPNSRRLVLDGIVQVDNRRVALINGNDYTEGEKIQGFLIQEISPFSVTLLAPDGKITELNIKDK